MKRNSVLIVLMIITASVYGCSSSSKSTPQISADNSSGYSSNSSSGYGLTSVAESEAFGVSAAVGAVSDTVRQDKIIRTAHISSETDSFDYIVGILRNIAADNGGYNESSNMWTTTNSTGGSRVFTVTLKIPAERYDDVKGYVESLGRLKSSNENMENVTAQYYDTEARLKTKETEEQRVLEMITRAEKVEELLALEQRLGEIRTDIELYRSRMLNIDRQASYSTINVTMTEVTAEKLMLASDDLPSRIRNSFISSVNITRRALESLIIFIAGIIIPCAILAVLTLVGVLIYKRVKRKS